MQRIGTLLRAVGMLVARGLPRSRAFRCVAESLDVGGEAPRSLIAVVDAVARGDAWSAALRELGARFDGACVAAVASHESVGSEAPSEVGGLFEALGTYVDDEAIFAAALAPGVAGVAGVRREDIVAVRLLRAVGLMVGQGVPLTSALPVCEAMPALAPLREGTRDVTRAVLGGASWSEALRRHPDAYAGALVEAVAIGEEVGILDLTLLDVAAELASRLAVAMGLPASGGEAGRARCAAHAARHALLRAVERSGTISAERHRAIDALRLDSLVFVLREIDPG